MILDKGQPISSLPQRQLKEAPSDGTWPFTVLVDGGDLLLVGVRATCFGGESDPQDNGETASGISTRPAATRGVALPRRYTGDKRAQIVALGGSPIPAKLPFHTAVEVTCRRTGEKLIAPFIDVGPAKKTGNALDLTVACAREFDPEASATRFEAIVDVRIIGGAKFLSA